MEKKIHVTTRNLPVAWTAVNEPLIREKGRVVLDIQFQKHTREATELVNLILCHATKCIRKYIVKLTFRSMVDCVVRWNISSFEIENPHIFLLIIQPREEIKKILKRVLQLFSQLQSSLLVAASSMHNFCQVSALFPSFEVDCHRNWFFASFSILLAFQWKFQASNFRDISPFTKQKKKTVKVRKKTDKKRNTIRLFFTI